MRKNEIVRVAAGVLAGIAISGPAAQAAEAAETWLKAIPSPNTVYVDGQKVELEAYLINGSSYVRLRDIGAAVGFNVYWDGAVQIDTGSSYTGEAPQRELSSAASPTSAMPGQPCAISAGHWSREDFSRQANPAIFTGPYTRELYNAMRQTLVGGGADGNNPTAYTMVSDGAYSAVKNLMGRLDGLMRYEHYVPDNLSNYYEWPDYFAMSASMPDSYQAPLDFIQPAIAETNRLTTDRAKVEYLNNYLCSLLTYKKNATAAIADVFSAHSGELPAACGTYARAFKFLCQAADIPCVTITTATHGWNMVYADGQWLHVDVSTNDVNNRPVILLAAAVPNRTDTAPEATAFLKELLVPGSTR